MALNRSDAAHFCRRVGYGGLPAELDFFTGMEVDAAVDYVLGVDVNPPPLPGFFADGLDSWEERALCTAWWIQRMADSTWVGRNPNTPSPLREKIAFFWHGHFASSDEKVYDFPKLFDQNVLYRNDGLGDFENLCQQISVGGAMLVYLDNATNVAGEPQENFARELMELFTMGVGNYTEDDVVSMARAWTGHNTVGWDNVNMVEINDYVFNAEYHDNGNKTLFGITRNWDGPETITEIVHGVRQQATARFISRKLFSHFAHAQPPESVVNELAAVFIGANMQIEPLVRAILVHPRFWGAESRHQLVKPPVDWLAEIVKRVGFPAEDFDPHWRLGRTGQTPFEPPNVSGWGENGYWLSTATAWGRQDLAMGSLWRAEALDLPFLNELGDEGVTEDQAADMVFDAFGIVDRSASSRNGLKSWFQDMADNNPWGLDHEGVALGAMLPEFHVA